MYAGIRRMLDDDGATSPPPAIGPRPADAPRLRRDRLAGVRPEVLGRDHLPGARRRDPRVHHATRASAPSGCRWFGGPCRAWSSSSSAPAPEVVAAITCRLAVGIASVGSLRAGPAGGGPPRRASSSWTARGTRTGGSGTTSRCSTTRRTTCGASPPTTGVRTAGRDSETFSSALGSRPEAGPMPWMIDMDGAAHSKRRRLVSGGFTPARVRATEPQLRAICDDLDRPRVRAGRVRRRAATSRRRCPMIVIGDMLGVDAGRPRRSAAVVPRDAGVAHR